LTVTSLLGDASHLIASGAEIARAISGARDITREELIHLMSKVTKMIERVLTTTPQWLIR
jgi:hypothetical protein